MDQDKIQKKITLLHLDRYLLSEVNSNRCLRRGNNGNVISRTTNDNVYVARHLIALVTIHFCVVDYPIFCHKQNSLNLVKLFLGKTRMIPLRLMEKEGKLRWKRRRKEI